MCSPEKNCTFLLIMCIMLDNRWITIQSERENAMLSDNQLTIAVCDDNPKDLELIRDMIRPVLQREGISHGISCYTDGRSLLADIRSGKNFHILFLDVLMEELNGLELAALLRRQKKRVPIVFISVNREMALNGYEVSAVRYLAKPVDPNRFEEALLRCVDIWKTKKEILLPTEQGEYRISVSDIQFIEAFDRGIRINTEQKIIESRLKFREAESLLPLATFIRCHRSFLVNPDHIQCIQPYKFVLRTGQHIPVGKSRYPEIRREFIQYLSD